MTRVESTALPAGTVTFLLTDIEDSSRHWEQSPSQMRSALEAHDALVAETVAANGGVVVKHLGDGCWAAFSSAPKAMEAAVEFQRRHQARWADLALQLRVRIGLHTGEIQPTRDDYFGPVVNRAARVVDLANGDQIVCSASTAGLLVDAELRNEGRHELRGIGDEDIFMILADGVETNPEPLRRPVTPSNLPRTHTSFHGRAHDVDRVDSFLRQHTPLVTLLGPGGVGKTRLAIEVAAGVAPEFQQRVYFCDLVPIRDNDADAVGEAVAEIVGARRQPDMTLVESIADHLTGRDSLVILDNCEHVLAAARDMARVLADTDGIHVLATSREALGLPLEQQVIVDPLAAHEAAVELFVDRARQRDGRFELDDDNVEAVRAVARRLDGIPLAIELAAARIRLMTPAELLERLDDGLRVLGRAGSRDRHETLQETVRWSYTLLSEAEAALFRRLSVFAGGFDLDTIGAVCAGDDLIPDAEVPDLLLSLVDKSMVVSTPASGRQRFTLLETLRAFAAEELAVDDPDGVFDRRHADHFAALARLQGHRFWSASEPDAWRILDAEWNNLRKALDTYQSLGEVDLGADLVTAVTWFANTALRFEVFTWAEELLELPGIESRRCFTDLSGVAALGDYFTVSGSPTERAEAGLAVDPGDPQGFCYAALAAVAMNSSQQAETADQVTRSWLETAPSTTGGRMWAACFRAFYLCTYSPGDEAVERVDDAAAVAEETGSLTARALEAWARGQLVVHEDLDAAMAIWTEGLEWSRSLPGDNLVEHLLDGLILFWTVAQDELLSSLRGCRDAVRGALDRHYFVGTSHLFGVSAIALARAGDAVTGARLVGAMTAHGHRARGPTQRALRAALGERLEAEAARGATLSVSQAGHLAIEALERAITRVEEQPS